MARTLVRPASGPLVFPTSGGTTLPLELPKDNLYRGLMLELILTQTIGTGATPTATASILEVIRNIRVQADGKLTLYNIDGFSLRELVRFWYGSAFLEDTFTAASTTFRARLWLPFVPPYLFDESVGLLPAVPLSGLQLQITCGTPANLLVAPGTATFDLTVNVESHEVTDLDPRAQVSPMIISQLSEQVVTGNPSPRFELPTGNRVAQIMVSSRSLNAGTTVFQGAMIAHQEIWISVPGLGPQPLRNTRLDINRAFNQIHGSGRRGGLATALATGFQVHNFVEDGRVSSPVDVSENAKIYSHTEQTAMGVTPTNLYTIVEQIPRVVEGGR